MADRLQEAKARQVYLVLRDRIMSGAIGFGARLPTENDLALAMRAVCLFRAQTL